MSASPRAKTKIAVMVGGLSMGGVERQLFAFLVHCDRERWSPMVYVSGVLGPWEEQIRELGIPVTLLHSSPAMKMWQFRQSCKAKGVRRFFSWSSYTNGYGLALLGLDIPRIGSFMSIYPPKSVGGFRWLRSWMSLAAISTIVCNSQEGAAAIHRRVGDSRRVVYVPNSVWPVEKAKLCRTTWRHRLRISEEELLILGVGRLVPVKNFSRFIKTVALVSQRLPIRAVVAGKDDGSLENLQRQVNASELGPGVIEFIGPVPDARELMCAADVFVLSSDFEGMPNVVMEAMAAGVPCVCTRVNGISAFIEQGVNGFITDHRADALAEKVLLLAREKKLRKAMGTKAARRMKHSSFDPKMIAARLWHLCE